MIRGAAPALIVLAIIGFASSRQNAPAGRACPNKRIVIAAGTLFDGKGKIVRNTRIVIDGSKIVWSKDRSRRSNGLSKDKAGNSQLLIPLTQNQGLQAGFQTAHYL
jgi:hypothetical protein